MSLAFAQERGIAPDSAPDSASHAASDGPTGPTGLVRALAPLVVDIAIPLGTYYLARGGFGFGLVTSLALSSVVPGIRTVLGLVRARDLNALAMLMLVVNLAGIALSFATGDARLMIAKDSVISSVIALSILFSVFARRPMMSVGLKPMITKGDPAKVAAWDRLAAGSADFRRYESAFSAVWGVLLLADCAARFVGAFTLPVTTMTWLSSVILVGAIGVAILISGRFSVPMERLIEAEARSAAEAV